jgi:hypothetical protein
MWMTNEDVQPGILGAVMKLKVNWNLKDKMRIVDKLDALSNYIHVD